MNEFERKSPDIKKAPSSKFESKNIKVKVKSKVALKEVRKKSDAELVKKAPPTAAEKIAAARKAIEGALGNMKSKAYQDLFLKYGMTLRSADFYLSIAMKESGLGQQAVSESNAKGLFQIKSNSKNALAEVNRFFGLSLKDKDIFSENENYQEQVAKNNALVGVLYWNICRDYYANKIKPDLVSDDKDKLGNMAYKMGPTMMTKLWKAVGDSKDFKGFATTLSQKIQENFPDELEIPADKIEAILDPTYQIAFNSYIRVKKNLPNSDVKISNITFDAANIIQTLRYAELIFSMNHTPPELKTPEVVKKDYYEVGENGKWFWGIAEEMYGKLMMQSMPFTVNMNTFMSLVSDYNKSIKNSDFDDFKVGGSLKKGSKVYMPTADFISKYLVDLQWKAAATTAATAPAATPSEKSAPTEKFGPMHELKGNVLMIHDSLFIPTFISIDVHAGKEKVELIKETKEGHDRVKVKIGNLVGYFQMEDDKHFSVGPLDKGGLWDRYNIHLDSIKNILSIALFNKEKEAKISVPTQKPSLTTTPDKKEISAKIDVMPKGVDMYTGKNAEKLEKEGKEMIQYGLDINTPPCELKIPNRLKKHKKDKDAPLDINHPPKSWDEGDLEVDNAKYIILHSTEGTGNGVESKLYHTQNIHYLLRLDGTVEVLANEWINPNIKDKKQLEGQRRIALNHAGLFKYLKYGAIWNGDENVSLHSIGIEVEAAEGEDYNKEQYEALKPLLEWIGARYKIPKANVLTHSMVAVSKWGRGRKADPSKLNWDKLGLPNNYLRIDPDVASGKIVSNIDWLKAEIKNGIGGWGKGTDETMIPGLEAADKLWKDKLAAEKAAKEAKEAKKK